MNEQVRNIPVSQLYPFPNRPFKVRNDDAMAELCASLRDYGVLSPLIVRPFEEGFQVVSGHRRRMAAIILGLQELPSLVRVMSDDDAVILLVDSNIQRENLLPSEKAFAYKMKLEAIKRKAGRPPKDNLCQVGTNLIGVRSDHIIASNLNESARTVQRYIRLTYLETSILDLVDDGRIAFSPAVELSFLKVRVYNLLQPEFSDSWNCMFDLGGDTLMAQILTDVIISNTKGDEKGDHFWDNGESNLLKSLILYVDLDSTRTPEERNLAAVYQMLTQHTEKELTMLFDRLPIGHPAKGPYSLFSQASDTVRAGIVLGLGTRLQVLQSEAVRRITRSSDIDLSEPGWSKCAYYIILDDQNSSLEFLSALFFAFLFIKLVRYADSTPEQRCKVPVNIILDEMNNIGTIKDFGRRLSTIRSRALQVIMCSQSLPQLQNRYPNNLWAELLGNADTQIMLGATDDVTAEYFSARSGDMTVEVNSTMTTRQSLALAQVIPQYRYTEGIGRRRVLTPDEVLRLPNDELLIILRGQKVLRAKKFDFTEHPYAKECERTSIQHYQSDPAPAQPPEPPAQSMPAEPDMDKPPGPAPAAAAKPPVKAKPSQAKPKAPVPKSPSSGGQPSELPAKPAKRPKTLYESSRPPADF